MAELDCFLTEDEFIGLQEKALDDGYEISLNKNLRQAVPEFVRSGEEVRARVKEGQYSLLLGRSDFTRHPVALRPIERGGQSYWYPRAKEGGPVIEIHYFAPFEKGGKKIVPCSLLSYQERIVNPSTRKQEEAGEPIKKAFAALFADLRGKSRRVKSASRAAYVSPGVDALISEGWSLGPPFDKAKQ